MLTLCRNMFSDWLAVMSKEQVTTGVWSMCPWCLPNMLCSNSFISAYVEELFTASSEMWKYLQLLFKGCNVFLMLIIIRRKFKLWMHESKKKENPAEARRAASWSTIQSNCSSSWVHVKLAAETSNHRHNYLKEHIFIAHVPHLQPD